MATYGSVNAELLSPTTTQSSGWRAKATRAVTGCAVLIVIGCLAVAFSSHSPLNTEPSGSMPPNVAALSSGPDSQLAEASGPKVWLGNGCFWARQEALVLVEQSPGFGSRTDAQVTALAGYAGALKAGAGGKVCYHSNLAGTDYSVLGFAEAVEVTLDAQNADTEFAALLKSFFSSFVQVSGGMQRPDPQDAGGQYRSVIGIPGGVSGPWFSEVKKYNIHAMELVEGHGSEGDQLNKIWVYDSDKFPFFRAEQYHQFYKGGAALKSTQIKLGRIDPTGCPESWF